MFCVLVSQASFFGLEHLQMDNQSFKKPLPKKTQTNNKTYYLLVSLKSVGCRKYRKSGNRKAGNQ